MAKEGAVLPREFYLKDSVLAARALLGKILVHETPEGRISGRIVETEAYMGPEDAGAHSYKHKGKDGRTNVQYGPGGVAYVYLIYGMYSCFNVVTNGEGTPHAVLVRAAEPVEGIALMERNRGTKVRGNLCSGPGKLCVAFGIDRSHYGCDLCEKPLYLEDGPIPDKIMASPRINIDYAGEYKDKPWRFFIEGNPYISKHKNNRFGVLEEV